jgi:putative endonuclease
VGALSGGGRLTISITEVIGVRATQAIGDYGERMAIDHLQAAGMTVLQRGWRCRAGEIDIVAVDGTCLVICEVKTRRSVRSGTPLEAVTPAKMDRLRRLTAAWLAEHGRRFDEVRIDVVAVTIPDRGAARVHHVRGVG